MKKVEYLLDLKNCVVIDEYIYRDLIIDVSKLKKQNRKLITIIERCLNYVTDDERELSVDCYYKFKDLCDFDDLYKIYLYLRNTEKNYSFFKYFDTEYEKDKFKEKLKYIPYLMLIEDSTDINFNYS